jgi:D-threo-aldose 1-dehydrogenase
MTTPADQDTNDAGAVFTDPPRMSTVGRTDLSVTRLGLGTIPLGGKYQPITDTQAFATVHAALAHGINWFDTAPRYGFGLAEQRLGRALAGVPRDRYVVATKVGWQIGSDGTRVPAFTRDAVQRGLELSLERLGIERVDIVHIHDPDDHYRQALEDVFPILAEWKAQGIVRAISAGMNQWQMLVDLAREADFDCFLLAGRYSLLEQGALETFLPLCAMRKISVFIGGVFNSGILATGARPGARYNYAAAPPEILERVRQLEMICARFAVPIHVAALQFPLAHPAVTGIVVGAASPGEVQANLAALSADVPPALWAELRDAGLLDPAAPTPEQETPDRRR